MLVVLEFFHDESLGKLTCSLRLCSASQVRSRERPLSTLAAAIVPECACTDAVSCYGPMHYCMVVSDVKPACAIRMSS